MKRMWKTPVATILLGIPGASWAGQEVLSEAPSKNQSQSQSQSGEIVVTGQKQSTVDLEKLEKGRTAFEKYHDEFAPTSDLLFQLKPRGGYDIRNATLRLVTGDNIIPVPVNGDGVFRLPAVIPAGSELQHNLGNNAIVVRPLVLSRSFTVERRPLGDYRLQCRVNWEMIKDRYSFVARAGFSAIGGCSSSKIALYYTASSPIKVAAYANGTHTGPVALMPNQMAYRPPIYDKALPNGTLIIVTY